jgi:hypothetical protein
MKGFLFVLCAVLVLAGTVVFALVRQYLRICESPMFYHIRLVNITGDRLGDKRFLDKLRVIQEQLNAPGKIDHTCLHEAGHLVYFRRAKIQADKYGPAIEYSEEKKDFLSCLAAIDTPTINEFTIYTLKLLADLAKAGVAANLLGDEFLKDLDADSALAKTLREEKQTVYENDLEKFKRSCYWARQFIPYTEAIKCWPDAEISVTRELKDQNIRDDIQLAAREIRQECFREISLTT